MATRNGPAVPEDAPIYFCCGRRGTGKTTVLRALAFTAKRLLVVDPFREHDVVWCDDAQALAEYLDGRKEFRAGLDYSEDADAVLAIAMELRDVTVVIEEAAFVCPPGQETPTMKKAIAQGRHYDLSLWATSQRPAQVSRLLTGQCDDIYAFAAHEPRDIQYLRSVLGPVAERLPNMPKLHGIHWQPSGRVELIRVTPRPARIETLSVLQENWGTACLPTASTNSDEANANSDKDSRPSVRSADTA